jgi:hypothetical protein
LTGATSERTGPFFESAMPIPFIDRLQDCQDALDAAREARDELRRQQAAPDNLDIYRMHLRESAALP